ncbi:MAG: hypothetical protein SangKO_026060 [Sandaracinaceae bacterium]
MLVGALLFIVLPLLSPLIVLHELLASLWLRGLAARCGNVRRRVWLHGLREIPAGYATWKGSTLHTAAGSWDLAELRRVESRLVRVGAFADGDEETYMLRAFGASGPPRATLATTRWGAELEPLREAGVLVEKRWSGALLGGLLWLPVLAGLTGYGIAGLWLLARHA